MRASVLCIIACTPSTPHVHAELVYQPSSRYNESTDRRSSVKKISREVDLEVDFRVQQSPKKNNIGEADDNNGVRVPFFHAVE